MDLLNVAANLRCLTVDGGRGDLQVDAVEGDLAGFGIENSRTVVDDPRDPLADEIREHGDVRVLEIDDAIGGVLSRCTAGRKGLRARIDRLRPLGRKNMGWLTDSQQHQARRRPAGKSVETACAGTGRVGHAAEGNPSDASRRKRAPAADNP